MEEFKGTKGEIIAEGINIKIKGKAGRIGQSFLININQKPNGEQLLCPESIANAQLWAASLDLLEALETIIGFNRQQAEDQYGDAEKAEKWSCVTVARKAINKALGKEATK